MTNHYTVAAGSDGEPMVVERQIRVRGYFADKVVEMVEMEGWEFAASKVCGYCLCYIEDEDEDQDFTNYVCNCSDEEQKESSIRPPI
ncbi:MAG: hypothetical protein J07AB43_02330 [Candidatus Nanosalina sp. J07AB43]|nr:MAG: hypothetical protein J07AB43_02330 [Candidatus Nanosalina sp. J07AB43]